MTSTNQSLSEPEYESEEIKGIVEEMIRMNPENLGTALGFRFLKIGRKEMIAQMPVDSRTIQPFGLLHGGASVALAETLASIGAFLNVDTKTEMTVGLEINANHLKPARRGWVTGTSKPVHVGKSTQVWETKITDESDRLICISRCTLAVVKRR